MKTLSFILATFILVQTSATSQIDSTINSKQNSAEYFSMSYQLGFGGTTNSRILSGEKRYDYSGGIELALHSKKQNEFFIAYTFRRFSAQDLHYPLTSSNILTGARLRLLSNRKLYFEIAHVIHLINGKLAVTNGYLTTEELFEGFLLGFGRDIRITDGISMSLFCRINAIYSRPGAAMFYDAGTRITFDNSEQEPLKSRSKQNKQLAVSVLAGVNNPDYFLNNLYKWGPSYGAELAIKTSPRLETTVTIINNNFVYKSSYYIDPLWGYSYLQSFGTIDVLLGERFFFNIGSVRSYMSLGAGLYSTYSDRNDYMVNTAPYFGMSFATGLLVHVHKSLSINMFPSINIIPGDRHYAVSHLKILSGLRFDL